VDAAALVAERDQRGDRSVTASLQSPWWRTFPVNGTARLRHVTVPAGASLVRHQSDPAKASGVLVFLVPDLGTASVHSYQTMVDGVFLAAGCTGLAGSRLFVATPDLDGSNARVEAWQELIDRARARHGKCLEPMVLRWSQVAERAPRLPRLARYAAVLGPSTAHFQIDQTFSLVSRHPYLMRDQLAILLGSNNAHVAAIERELSRRGWVRAVKVRTISCEGHDLRVGERALLELTSEGWRAPLERSLLQKRRAVRHQGLSDDRVRRQLFPYLSHTVGANSVFVTLVHAARVVNERGGDEALEGWRSAVGCARGRFRPDGYGSYRRGRTRHGFFLEYDRGTERSREYLAKLASYYLYRERGGWQHEFRSFPVVLVVTNSERAERRFAEAADRQAKRTVGHP